MKSLREIEDAIVKLSKESQLQLIRDIPVLCPEAFPSDGWDSIVSDSAARPALSSFLDHLETEYRQKPGKFLAVNDDTLREPEQGP